MLVDQTNNCLTQPKLQCYGTPLHSAKRYYILAANAETLTNPCLHDSVLLRCLKNCLVALTLTELELSLDSIDLDCLQPATPAHHCMVKGGISMFNLAIPRTSELARLTEELLLQQRNYRVQCWLP